MQSVLIKQHKPVRWLPVFLLILVLSAATNAQAETADTWYQKGQEALSPGEAISDYDEAIRINPDFAAAYHDRGVAYQKLGEIRKAIRDFDEAIRINEKNVSAFYNRGVCYTLSRLYKRAIHDFKKVIEVAPKDPRAYNNLAWIYAVSDDPKYKNPKLAIQYATKAVELSGETNASYVDTLGEAYYAAGNYREAVKWVKKAVALNPDSSNLKDHLEQYRKALSEKR